MLQAKSCFRGKRDESTRQHFQETRYMTHAFPEVYSPDKPYKPVYKVGDFTPEPMNYGDFGPRYCFKEIRVTRRRDAPPSPPSLTEEEIYTQKVLREADTSAKKVRSSSHRAQKTSNAMIETIDQCKSIQKSYTDTVDSLTRTARLAFLKCLKPGELSEIPQDWLEDEDNGEL